MAFKLCEVFSESIPVSVVQVHTILTSKEFDMIIISALFTSAAFVSEAVTYMTFVKDINEESRKTGTLFYGFMPLSGIRVLIVKLSMYMLSFCQILGKSLQIAMLMLSGGRSLVIFVLLGEFCLYILYVASEASWS